MPPDPVPDRSPVLPGAERPGPPAGWVLYVDLDAYYVSCELRTRPELLGRPVIVGPPPDGGFARGVVLSASYEARAFKVRSAMPVAAAARLCPDAVWIPPDFPKYEATAQEVRRLLARHAEKVIPYSIDEAALLIPSSPAEAARAHALAVQAALRAELGLPSSIGVAPWRVVAKIASDRAKPGGVVVVPGAEVSAFLAPLPVRSIPGVGPKTESLLRSHGVETVGDLAARRSNEFIRSLGQFAPELIRLARGAPVESDDEAPGPRSRSTDHTFDRDVDGWTDLERAVRSLADSLAASLDREGFRFGAVGVQFRWSDFSRSARLRALPAAREGAVALRSAAERLARELWEVEGAGGHRAVRTVSVRTERLIPKTQRQRALTDFPAAASEIK